MRIYQQMHDAFQRYNPTADMLKEVYGIDSHTNYDAIIVAPSWTPNKLFAQWNPTIQVTKQGPYFCGYEVVVQNKKYGFIQTSSGSGSIIDCCMMLGTSICSKIFFVGAVGALTDTFKMGDIVTPLYSIAGDGGSLYLYDLISEKNYRNKNFQKQDSIDRLIEVAEWNEINVQAKVVYCTDTIFCEYFHLNEIKSLGSELIEMETAAFMRCMEIIEKQYNIILCVSDNSSCGYALVGRSEVDTNRYHNAREVIIPKLLMGLSKKLFLFSENSMARYQHISICAL